MPSGETQRGSIVVREERVTAEDAPEPGCDCPCHQGASVFHIVSCCGSLLTFPLWRPEPADLSPVPGEATETSEAEPHGHVLFSAV
jgi:hypothetical protein